MDEEIKGAYKQILKYRLEFIKSATGNIYFRTINRVNKWTNIEDVTYIWGDKIIKKYLVKE